MSKKHELSKEKYEKVKHLLEKEETKYKSLEDLVGGIIFIRTVTHYYVGTLREISGQFLMLDNASWIADTGRMADFKKGSPTSSLEVEPMGDNVGVNIETIVDFSPYKNLFTSQI